MSILTVGSMFAGVGGICLAFKNAGFDLKWANEVDAKACKTYKMNFHHKLSEKDVCEIKEPLNDLGSVDIITAGFPCQAFSIAGYQKGFEDPRGNLFFETARFIDKLQPKAFLLENVKNLKNHDKGNTLNVIKNTIINDLGYSFISFVLNAKDYGNIPQNRERIYIVGFRNEGKYINNKRPDNDNVNVFDSMNGQYICSTNFNIPKPIMLKKNPRSLLYSEKQLDNFYYNEKHKYYETLNSEMSNKNSFYQWRRVYVRENKSGVCPTLTANMGTGGHNVPIIVDDYGIRKLTPRECFRFQGFPEHFKLPQELSNASLYKQAGNSVVVPVVERIAKEIKRVINIKYNDD